MRKAIVLLSGILLAGCKAYFEMIHDMAEIVTRSWTDQVIQMIRDAMRLP